MNVKQGDLAYIVPPATQNVGRIVEVMRFRGIENGYAVWVVRAKGEPLAGLSRSTGQPGSAAEVGCFDIALRPISGVPLNDDIETEKPIEEVA